MMHVIPRICLLRSFLGCIPLPGSSFCFSTDNQQSLHEVIILYNSFFSPLLKKKPKPKKPQNPHDKRVVTSIRKAIKTLTLWSLLLWAVCFVKHFFSQCQAGITKCDNQMQIICMYNKLNSWTVQITLIFVILMKAIILTFTFLNFQSSVWCFSLMSSRACTPTVRETTGILSLISKGPNSDQWCQQQSHHKAIRKTGYLVRLLLTTKYHGTCDGTKCLPCDVMWLCTFPQGCHS